MRNENNPQSKGFRSLIYHQRSKVASFIMSKVLSFIMIILYHLILPLFISLKINEKIQKILDSLS